MPSADRMTYAMAEAADRPRLGAAHPAKIDVVQRIAQRHPGEPMLVIGQFIDQLEEIAERLGAAPDHPMTIEFPEGEYLKGLVVVRKP